MQTVKHFTYHSVVIQAGKNSHLRIKGREVTSNGVSSFCSIPLLLHTLPQYLDPVKLNYFNEKPMVSVRDTTLHLFFSAAFSAFCLFFCLSEKFGTMILRLNTTIKMKGYFTLPLYLYCMVLFVALEFVTSLPSIFLLEL